MVSLLAWVRDTSSEAARSLVPSYLCRCPLAISAHFPRMSLSVADCLQCIKLLFNLAGFIKSLLLAELVLLGSDCKLQVSNMLALTLPASQRPHTALQVQRSESVR